ncbi:MAG: hypothetical protein DCF18_08660 [Cyanobium sp.]|nr:MAG: hypothetical protein DCF18_08660 [Cyanobium sp.]
MRLAEGLDDWTDLLPTCELNCEHPISQFGWSKPSRDMAKHGKWTTANRWLTDPHKIPSRIRFKEQNLSAAADSKIKRQEMQG